MTQTLYTCWFCFFISSKIYRNVSEFVSHPLSFTCVSYGHVAVYLFFNQIFLKLTFFVWYRYYFRNRFFSSEFFGRSILSRIQYILMQDYESVLAVGINKTTLINLPDSLVVWPNFQTSRESKYWNIIMLASVATLTNENWKIFIW